MDPAAQRLFLAVPVSPEARRALQDHLRAHAGPALPGRAVPPENWHLTLRFLGDTPSEAELTLRQRLREAELGGAFEVMLGACGAFPRESRASVLWVGLAEGGAALRSLAAKVEEAVRDAGFPAERRPFAAHLTISRLRSPEDVGPLLARIPAVSHRMPVDEVVLYRSLLGSGPPRYEPVARYPLA